MWGSAQVVPPLFHGGHIDAKIECIVWGGQSGWYISGVVSADMSNFSHCHKGWLGESSIFWELQSSIIQKQGGRDLLGQYCICIFFTLLHSPPNSCTLIFSISILHPHFFHFHLALIYQFSYLSSVSVRFSSCGEPVNKWKGQTHPNWSNTDGFVHCPTRFEIWRWGSPLVPSFVTVACSFDPSCYMHSIFAKQTLVFTGKVHFQLITCKLFLNKLPY